jgi:hypothetical protein
MNDETKEWIEKAEGDFTGAQVLLQERRARTAISSVLQVNNVEKSI